MVAMALHLYSELGIARDFDIAGAMMANFVRGVREGYSSRPFHNFSHGVYVVHGAIMFFKQCSLVNQLLKPIDRCKGRRRSEAVAAVVVVVVVMWC